MHVCVVHILSPFGSFARMGSDVGCMLMKGAVVVRKWLLAPESMMAHSCTLSAVRVIVERREGVGVERKSVGRELITDVLLFRCNVLHKLFAPNVNTGTHSSVEVAWPCGEGPWVRVPASVEAFVGASLVGMVAWAGLVPS